jgi:hypothetical protein
VFHICVALRCLSDCPAVTDRFCAQTHCSKVDCAVSSMCVTTPLLSTRLTRKGDTRFRTHEPPSQGPFSIRHRNSPRRITRPPVVGKQGLPFLNQHLLRVLSSKWISKPPLGESPVPPPILRNATIQKYRWAAWPCHSMLFLFFVYLNTSIFDWTAGPPGPTEPMMMGLNKSAFD